MYAKARAGLVMRSPDTLLRGAHSAKEAKGRGVPLTSLLAVAPRFLGGA